MPAVSTIIAGAGLGLAAYGMISGAAAQADAEERDAALKRLQADEVIRRMYVKEEEMRKYGIELEGQQSSAISASGFDYQGSPLLLMETTKKNVEREILEMQRDAMFRADQLRKGADISMDISGSTSTAGWIQAGGTVLGGVAKMPIWDKAGPAKSLNTGVSTSIPTTTV